MKVIQVKANNLCDNISFLVYHLVKVPNSLHKHSLPRPAFYLLCFLTIRYKIREVIFPIFRVLLALTVQAVVTVVFLVSRFLYIS